MNIKGADILGVSVLESKENKKIGEVKDLIYNPKENKVIALLITEGGVIAEPQVLPFSEIKEITDQKVISKSEKSLKPGSKYLQPIMSEDDSDTYMQGTKIVSESGDELGVEHDIYFDTKTGNVQQLEVVKGSDKKTVPVAKVINSSDDATIIQMKKPQEESGSMMDKLKGLLGK